MSRRYNLTGSSVEPKFSVVCSLASSSLSAERLLTVSSSFTLISGSLSANDGNQAQGSYDLDLDLNYEKVFSSADRNVKLEFDAAGSSGKGSTLGAKSTSDYSAQAIGTVDNYFTPGSKAAFWYGKGLLGAKKDQVDPRVELTAGVGYGRVVNVTPLARSIRIIESLIEDGFLKGDPSNAVYQKVAVIVDKENEYRSKYGARDYEQYLVQDIQSAIESSNMVNGKLNARAILRSYYVLTQEKISTRKTGWLVRAGVGARVSDFQGNDGAPLLEIGAEYHKPLNNSTQFSNEALISTAFKSEDRDSTIATNLMTLTYEVSDLIDWENTWSLKHEEYDNAKDVTTNSITSGFYYSLTNQLDLGVIGRLDDIEDRNDGNGNDKVDQSLNIGLKYRLK